LFTLARERITSLVEFGHIGCNYSRPGFASFDRRRNFMLPFLFVLFPHYCRTVLTVLGIVSEIELYCKLNNREQLLRVWTTLAGLHADTKDVYQVRYQGLLT